MNVFLIGYRGTGKTTVARLVAQQLKNDWIDADVEIERRAGKTIAGIFAESGESGFRELEAELVRELARELGGTEGTIVALGGGAVLRADNRQALRECGQVIWLLASPETIARRIQADPGSPEQRPNLTTAGGIDEIRNLLDKRAPIYRNIADHTIDTEGNTAEQVAAQVVAILEEG